MKKAVIIAMGIALAASPALAKAPVQSSSEFFFKPYMGADYQYVGASYKSVSGVNFDNVISDSMHGAHFHAGARFHKNFGFEFGYMWTGDAEKENVLGTTTDTQVNIRGFTADLMGYLPVLQQTELVGTVGISNLTAEAKVNGAGGAANVDETEVGFRVGGGFQYWLTDNINARALIRYQSADFQDTTESAVLVNAGLNYQFDGF